jgi:hypothetical protein
MATVRNFKMTKNNQHDNTANASQKQKSCKATAQADTQLQHICFCPDAPMPTHRPKELKAVMAFQNG